MTEPQRNPRIRVTYEFAGYGGYFMSHEDLEQHVDQWIQSAMDDREASMREISRTYTGWTGDLDDYPVMTDCRCGALMEGPQPDCREHGCPACLELDLTGHAGGCLYTGPR